MRMGRFVVACLAAMLAVSAAGPSSVVNVQVTNQINTAVGIKGRLQVSMSTSFQLLGPNFNFFSQAPQAPAVLDALTPQHTRLQVVSSTTPLTAVGEWNFSELDAYLTPIQSAADHSLE